MSHYVEVKAQYRDQAILVAALEELAGKGNVEVHATPVKMIGYLGAEGEACHVIVRREAYDDGRSPVFGDLGFRRNADGSFSQFIDDMDQPRFARLPQRYARAVTIKQAKLSGYTVTEEVAKDGTVKLGLSKWSAP